MGQMGHFMSKITIRLAEVEDQDFIWGIIKQVISKGDTYVFAPDSGKDKMLSYWCDANKHTYVAIIDEEIIGTFIIKQNQPDLGAHVANASFMTHPSYFGQGIGTAMGEFCLREAKRLGFLSMQFNIVVKNNQPAIRLWEKLGFRIIGEIPEAFQHAKLGLTSAYVMWRKL